MAPLPYSIGRVRMKTPTAKGVLNLNAFKEEANIVSENEPSPMEHSPSLAALHSHPGSPEQIQKSVLEHVWHRYAGRILCFRLVW
ncbi:histone-lysine N-methyltransferase 2B-like [Notechis scutatus]|uniref:Histone-lysine N-methyltransferase 2B-like n=1 Tax=Notechis scutatus TaxID=8663 RepID=A0A6J1W8X1_9SAUR|nr:histone-lysine N-methyltransferase 2B-like [Notechis scutatus]